MAASSTACGSTRASAPSTPHGARSTCECIRTLLRPGGLLLACFYPLREGTDGPPFPVSREEIERVLAPGFVVRSAHAPARSVERRRGLEWLVLAERS